MAVLACGPEGSIATCLLIVGWDESGNAIREMCSLYIEVKVLLRITGCNSTKISLRILFNPAFVRRGDVNPFESRRFPNKLNPSDRGGWT